MDQEIIRNFVCAHARCDRSSVSDDTPLFSTGLIDSFGVLELIAFLEERFGVTIDPAAHDLDHFDTVDKIVTLVDRLRSCNESRVRLL